MKKVLQVMDGLGRGGAQTFIINNIEELYNKGIVCDFLIRRDNSVYTDFIEKFGGRVILTAPFPRKIIKNYMQTREIFRNHAQDYCAIHVHANALLYLLPIKLAKREGIPVRIIHSHNTKTNVPCLKWLHYFNRRVIEKYATDFLACGQEAAEWMFTSNQYKIINNCISEKDFLYSINNRKDIRKKYNITDDTTIIGHVGAFKRQKNHEFILTIFSEYLKTNPNSKLFLLGTGVLYDEIVEKAKEMNLRDKVIFAGSQGEIYKYYHAMDVFLFPSLFEGLPFSLIEAQMSGLPSVISDAITDECIVTDIVKKMSLNSKTSEWADAINLMLQKKVDRQSYCKTVSKAGYGIKNSADCLAKVYLNISN